jgi:mycothiol synthase
MSESSIPDRNSPRDTPPIVVRPFRLSESDQLVALVDECMQADHYSDRVGPTTWLPGVQHVSLLPQAQGIVATASGTITGAAWLERAVGARVICHLFVRPDWRQSAAAQMLLTASVANARAYPERTFDLPVTPNESYKLILCQADGFHYIRSWWRVAASLSNLPELQLPADGVVRSFVPGSDEALLTNMVNAAFSQHWGEGQHSLEEITERIAHPAFRPELVVFLMQAGEAIGYSWSWIDKARIALVGEKRGYISDLGIVASHRGKGLGRFLLLHALRELQRQGMVSADLDVDGPNLPARQLYRSVGFVDVLEQRWFRRSVPADPEPNAP